MRQITPKRLTCSSDFSESALIEAIKLLYNPSFDRPLEDVRFVVFLSDSSDAHELLKIKDNLKAYNIEFSIATKGVLRQCAYIIYCPDTGSVLTCEGM